jgi:hypothetical protein
MTSQGLLERVKTTPNLLDRLEEDIANGMTGWVSTWSDYLDILTSEFYSLDSVLMLLRSSRYKDCMILLRAIFEYYFLLLLMMKGRRYRFTVTYHVETQNGLTQKDARDQTYEKWIRSWKSGKPQYSKVIRIQKGHDDDIIRITTEDEGLYDEKDVERKGDTTPLFFFMFQEYDPDIHFLSDLATIYEPGSQYKQIAEKHKHIYSQYLNINKIADNLELNGLLGQEQLERFWVHYNFLSSFAHPTRRGLLELELKHYLASEPQTRKAIEELILSYVAHFQAMFLRLVVGYFGKKNAAADLSTYTSYAQELERCARKFWFIYNDPTEVDIVDSRVQKEWMKMEGLPVPDGVLYYSNPIDRMKRVI